MSHSVAFPCRGALKSGAVVALFLSVCAVAQAQPSPRQVTDADVQGCRLLARVSGDSGYGKNNGWQGLAKQAAMGRAEKLGASDVVWESFTPVGAFNGMVVAKAYVCGQGQTQRTASSAD